MSPRPLSTGPDLEVRLLAECFLERFGDPSDVRYFFSPGRVNLMGAHLDYNGGPVMPTAIDRGTVLALRPRRDRQLRLESTVEPGGLAIDVDHLPTVPRGAWTDYPIGVLREVLAARRAPTGMDVLVGGNLPIGAGLSSSASICVGTAFAFDEVWSLGGGPLDWIRAALHGEREFVGVQCGIMDPYAVALTRPGHLLWLDCADQTYEHVPLDAVHTRICVADSGVRRELARGDFNTRVAECRRAFELLAPRVPRARFLRDVPIDVVARSGGELGDLLLRRARHVTGEVQRTFEARRALERNDLAAYGRAMSDAHASLRDDYEVSIPELDLLVETALGVEGVFGARLTGAGFGGCVVALCRAGAESELSGRLRGAFHARFGIEPVIESFRSDSGPRELTAEESWAGD